MKRYRVAIEKYQYYGVYVKANSEEEAESIVERMMENSEDGLPKGAVDDGEGDVRLVDGETYEVDENGEMLW